MQVVLVALAFLISLVALTFVGAILIVVAAPRIGMRPDFGGVFAVAVILGLVGAAYVAMLTNEYVTRDERALDARYAPMLDRIASPLRRGIGEARSQYMPDRGAVTVTSDLGAPQPGKGIVVVSESASGFTLHADRMLDLPECCRAPVGGMPRFVIVTHRNTVVTGHRVGAGAGPVEKHWYDVHLIDLANQTTEFVKSETTVPHAEAFPDKPYEKFVERAMAIERCGGK